MNKLLVLFILCLTLVSCSNLPSSDLPTETQPALNVPEKIEPTLIEPEKTIVTRAHLVAIGDILLHEAVYLDASTTQGSYDFSSMFTKVKPFLEGADIAVANQETMIGGVELGLSSYPTFNSPYEIGDALKDSGIDIVTIANNHTLDHGEKAILNGINHWDRIGMLYTGAFKSNQDREDIRTIQKNDITFSFMSYSYGTNGIPVPEGKPYLINLIDLPLIKQDVEKAKLISDVVVVSMHWGNEYEKKPNQTQIDLATELSDMGVDIIIGHHPHVLQPVDWIERSDGSRTFVMYSLGNFLSGQVGLEKLIGGIGGVEITKTTFEGKSTIALANPSFLPTYGYYDNWRNFEVIPFYQLNDSYLPNYLMHYEDTQNHLKEFTNEITFNER
ncbi:CapA family protein [Paenisporosarcina antarctica]|uniref:CapA family protein n=1 Tax=Paenisporosarcina antarctica TaxID=417367 RepID=A0A4P7A1L9_9BACL|nr:CapA family protein [Paenisporosarcina antarctica]QBP42752.1 CapA family protein [Paenisporosarcina antarctica]